MRSLVILALLVACSSESATPSTAPSPTAGGPAGPGGPGGPGPGNPPGPSAPGPGMGVGGGAEDLASSWRPALAVEVGSASGANQCPDADGDGFPSAVACSGADPTTLDCDDTEVAVGPASERWVAPGAFIMGSASSQAGPDEKPPHIVRLAGYCLDVTEVSAADFSAWLVAAGRRPAGADVRNMDPLGRLEADRGAFPAEGVTWQEASDYCGSLGKALPTEAQWEKAARGGCELAGSPAACDPQDLRPYPWGTEAPACERANHQYTGGSGTKLCRSDTMPVDSLPEGAGPYGHLHLAGNVWEYVGDTWHPATYGDGSPRTDPGGPQGGDAHVLRGGGWNTFSTNMRVANRFSDVVMGSASGFRCARPTVAPEPDAVPPLVMVTIEGTVRREEGKLDGRALYVTAFDQADTDPNSGVLAPGRSPAAEVRLVPGGAASQVFSLRVPAGHAYLLMGAMDAGTGAQKDAYVSASGSGGFGPATHNPVRADKAVSGVEIVLQVPRGAGPPGSQGGPPGPPGGPGGPPGAPR